MRPLIDRDLMEFLRRTLGDGIQLVAIREGCNPDAASFGENVEVAATWAQQWNHRDLQRGIYYSPNRVRTGLNKKAAKSDIEEVRFAHVDIDPPKDSSRWDSDAVIQKLEQALIPPSVIIGSGAGIQALWRLESTTSIAEAEEINRALISEFGGDPGTWNIDRILRLPGTMNWPNKKKAALGRKAVWAKIAKRDDGTIYSAAGLLEAYPPSRTAHRGAPPATFSLGPIELHDVTNLDLPPNDPLYELIETPPSCDRSADTLKLAGMMVRRGYDDSTIAGTLLNPINPISAHCMDQVDPKRAAVRAIVKVRADAAARIDAKPGPVPPASDVEGPPRLPEPFPGFMAEAVAIVLKTAHKPQPELAKLTVLVAMASSCGGGVGLPDGGRLNIYGLGVAPTGGGKEHCIRAAKAIAREGGARLLGDFASGAGIEDELTSDLPMLSVQDEIAHALAARQDKGNPHLKGVEKSLLTLFSASGSAYTTRSLANRPSKTIDNPCLNLLGFAVPMKLGEALSDGDAASGLLGRMLMACGDGDAAPQLGVSHPFAISAEMASVLEAVRKTRLGSLITLEPDAQAEATRLVLELHEETRHHSEESPERCLLIRTYEKAMRLAGVVAVFAWAELPVDTRPERPTITREHLLWAADFARASDATMIYFIRQHMHGGKVQADAHKLRKIAMSALRGEIQPARPSEVAALQARQVPTSLLLRCSRLPRKEMDEVVEHMVAGGDVLRGKFAHKSSVGAERSIQTIFFPED